MKIAVKVPRDEEELYRRAEKVINSKVNTYNEILNGRRSEKEILFAVMLDIAVSLEREARRNDTGPFSEILDKLTGEIEEALSK